MDLRQLRYFVAVAEEGSITRAAARLGLQQPPLSQQIQQIEAELGVVLFDRVSRRVRLNAAGAMFLTGARKTLAAAQDATDAVQRFGRGEEGRVSIGFTSSASLHAVTPTMLRTFRAVFPKVVLDVEVSDSYELMLALDQRRVDVAFMRNSGWSRPELASHILVEEPLLVAFPSDHPLAGSAGGVTLQELVDTPVVLYQRREGSGIYNSLAARFRDAGFEPRVVDEVARTVAALNLVAAGRGVAFVPASMRIVHPEMIAYRPLEPSAPRLPLHVVFRPDNETPAVGNFVEIACSAAAAMGAV